MYVGFHTRRILNPDWKCFKKFVHRWSLGRPNPEQTNKHYIYILSMCQTPWYPMVHWYSITCNMHTTYYFVVQCKVRQDFRHLTTSYIFPQISNKLLNTWCIGLQHMIIITQRIYMPTYHTFGCLEFLKFGYSWLLTKKASTQNFLFSSSYLKSKKQFKPQFHIASEY